MSLKKWKIVRKEVEVPEQIDEKNYEAFFEFIKTNGKLLITT